MRLKHRVVEGGRRQHLCLDDDEPLVKANQAAKAGSQMMSLLAHLVQATEH